EPMIETRVLPSLLPDEGRIAVMFGVPPFTVPKTKQLETTTGSGDPEFARKFSVIVTGVDGESASGKAGVLTCTCVAVTLVTSPSRVTPAAVKKARVLAALPGKRPPLMDS